MRIRGSLGTLIAACTFALTCGRPTGYGHVEFANRHQIAVLKQSQWPLVVQVTGDGRLRLNKIETGSVADPSELATKLETVFADRAKSGITERKVLVEPAEYAATADIQRLIDALVRANAGPILVLKDDAR